MLFLKIQRRILLVYLDFVDMGENYISKPFIQNYYHVFNKDFRLREILLITNFYPKSKEDTNLKSYLHLALCSKPYDFLDIPLSHFIVSLLAVCVSVKQEHDKTNPDLFV